MYQAHNANEECQINFETDLAIIETKADIDEAYELCKSKPINFQKEGQKICCLAGSDAITEGVWLLPDGSDFSPSKVGWYPSGGLWGQEENSVSYEDFACIVVHDDLKKWPKGIHDCKDYGCYPLCNTPPTAEPTKNPTTTTTKEPTDSPTLGPLCIYGKDYNVDPQNCIIKGDPHVYQFRGLEHDFQGSSEQLFHYYVHPCDGVSRQKMPFNIIGKHHNFPHTHLKSLHYLVLELFDSNNDIFYIWLSSPANFNPRYLLSLTRITEPEYPRWQRPKRIGTDLEEQKQQDIGHIFKTFFTKTGNHQVHFKLIINNRIPCEVNIYIRREGSIPEQNHVIIKPFNCYNCFTCGLCGDLKEPGTDPIIETCDGTKKKTFTDSSPEIYLENGWGWENAYVHDHCLGRRRLSSHDHDGVDNKISIFASNYWSYIASAATKFVERASPLMIQTQQECDLIRKEVNCSIIGDKICDFLRRCCIVDTLVMSQGDLKSIARLADVYFRQAVDFMISIEIQNPKKFAPEAGIEYYVLSGRKEKQFPLITDSDNASYEFSLFFIITIAIACVFGVWLIQKMWM